MAATNDDEGGAGRDAAAAAGRVAAGDRPRGLVEDGVAAEQVVTLAEERATITRRLVEAGLVRVSTRTEILDHVERATLNLERVEVEHRPVNAWADTMPQVREEEDVTIVPIVEERLVIEKRLFVTEEIHIRRVRSTEEVELPVTLRRQQAVVERLAPAEGGARAPAAETDLNQ